MKTSERSGLALLAALALLLGACGGEPPAHEDEAARGPHGGRLLAADGFALELLLFEAAGGAEWRAWASESGEPVAPSDVELALELRRFGGRIERVTFTPAGEFLRGDRAVEEPHSFDVSVVARSGGREHRFAFESHEARVEIAAEAARAAGIAVETAGPARIRESIALYGRVEPDADRTAHVTPRFPGIALEVRKRLGDAVAAGEVVAVVESNESLRPYELRSRIAGTVIAKSIVPGEFVASDAAVYAVSDLSRVWVDLAVHRRDFARLAVGQAVAIEDEDGGAPIGARLAYLAPFGLPDSQALLARAVVENADGRLRPGLFVTAHVTVREVEAPVAVRVGALQRMRETDVVFRTAGELYEAQPVEIGARDAEWAEVRAGLAAGDAYVAAGSFVLKADAGKSGASHDH